jgi:hypothetical protein
LAAEDAERRRVASEEMKRLREESDRCLKALAAEDLEYKELRRETELQQKLTMEAVRSLSGSIGREWGALVESLTEASCLQQMQAAGMKVTQTCMETESEREGCEQEWDAMLINGGELVAIEVKSRMRETHVKRIIEKLKLFKKAFPQYRKFKVYGGAAAIKFDAGGDRAAEKAGLFVFKPSGQIMHLANAKGFKPKAF